MNVNLPTHACDRERLESFLSGDLSEAAEREFAVHLNSCENCRRSLADQAAEPEAWREAEMLLKPSEFDSQIANELTNRDPRSRCRFKTCSTRLVRPTIPRCLGVWAVTRSPAWSAPAAWESCSRRSISRWIARWRSRY